MEDHICICLEYGCKRNGSEKTIFDYAIAYLKWTSPSKLPCAKIKAKFFKFFALFADEKFVKVIGNL